MNKKILPLFLTFFTLRTMFSHEDSVSTFYKGKRMALQYSVTDETVTMTYRRKNKKVTLKKRLANHSPKETYAKKRIESPVFYKNGKKVERKKHTKSPLNFLVTESTPPSPGIPSPLHHEETTTHFTTEARSGAFSAFSITKNNSRPSSTS